MKWRHLLKNEKKFSGVECWRKVEFIRLVESGVSQREAAKQFNQSHRDQLLNRDYH